MFEVLPAIDVLSGQAVRLREGRRNHVTVHAGDPGDLAARFVEEGATRLHLIDLDGAFSGAPTPGLVTRVASAARGVPVQVGGGYRALEDIEAALAAGASRVLIGTAALSPGFLARAAGRFGDSLIVAIDARDGRVATEGWTSTSELSPGQVAARCAGAGVARLLTTSTRRDGSLAGPDLALVTEVVACGLPVLAAGGVSSVADLVVLRDLGCEGAIAGSALLRGRFSLQDAFTATTRG
jgi:phosphoribosylformimino-5-aminoimidazole carboxamide ribotide isomerase